MGRALVFRGVDHPIERWTGRLGCGVAALSHEQVAVGRFGVRRTRPGNLSPGDLIVVIDAHGKADDLPRFRLPMASREMRNSATYPVSVRSVLAYQSAFSPKEGSPASLSRRALLAVMTN